MNIADLVGKLETANWDLEDVPADVKQELHEPSTIQGLSEALSSDDYFLRVGAGWALVLAGQPAREILVSALRREAWQARHAAAYNLWLLRDPGVVPDLIMALGDSEWQVRAAAAESLSGIGNISAIPALIETLRDKDGMVYEAAVYALCELAEISPAQELFQALNDENKKVRVGAAFALGGKGGVAVISGLFECVRQGGIGGDVSDFERMRDALVQIGKPAIPSLSQALKDESVELRFFAAEALGWIGDPETVPILAEALNDEHQDVQYHAVSALQALGNRSVPLLINALKLPSEYVRLHAVDALWRIGTPEALAAVEQWQREQGGQQA